jgi:hypothetical protein
MNIKFIKSHRVKLKWFNEEPRKSKFFGLITVKAHIKQGWGFDDSKKRYTEEELLKTHFFMGNLNSKKGSWFKKHSVEITENNKTIHKYFDTKSEALNFYHSFKK